MHYISAHDLSLHFTRLIGCRVGFTEAAQLTPPIAKSVFGVYKSFPSGNPILLEVDLCLIGSLAGAFIGLPESEISRRINGPDLDDVLRDAITEIFNVGASVVSIEDRAVFVSMSRDRHDLSSDLTFWFASGQHRQHVFRVSVEGYTGGVFRVLL